jgi:hypothetical protein
VNGPVDAPSAEQGAVGGVDEGVDGYLRDVAGLNDDFDDAREFKDEKKSKTDVKILSVLTVFRYRSGPPLRFGQVHLLKSSMARTAFKALTRVSSGTMISGSS